MMYNVAMYILVCIYILVHNNVMYNMYVFYTRWSWMGIHGVRVAARKK